MQDKLGVQKLCNEDGLTQQEVAELFGITQQAVSRIVADVSLSDTSQCDATRLESRRRSRTANGLMLSSVFAYMTFSVTAAQLPVEPNYLGEMSVQCGWCKALHWPDEPSRIERIDGIDVLTFQSCCAHGKWREEDLPYPSALKPFLSRQHPQSDVFHERIRNLNSACAFASINAETYNFPSNGPYCFRVHGAVLNKFNTSGRPASDEDRPRYGQLYVINSDDALKHRLEEPANRGVPPGRSLRF